MIQRLYFQVWQKKSEREREVPHLISHDAKILKHRKVQQFDGFGVMTRLACCGASRLKLWALLYPAFLAGISIHHVAHLLAGLEVRRLAQSKVDWRRPSEEIILTGNVRCSHETNLHFIHKQHKHINRLSAFRSV